MNAQNSRAKILVNAFEKQIEVANKALEQNRYKTAEGKIASLERSLASIKKKDPEFNTSNLEQKLEDLKTRCGANKTETLAERKEMKNAFDEKLNGQKIMSKFLSEPIITQELADKVIAANKDYRGYGNDVEDIQFRTKSVDRNISRLKVQLSEGAHNETMGSHFNDLNSKKIFWQTAATILPEEPAVVSASKKYNDFAKTVGSFEDAKTTSKAFQNEKLTDKKMPKAVISDVNLESIFKTAFNNESKDTNWDRTLLKVNITDSDWTIIKHKYTGAILGRKHFAAIAFKDNKKGECRLYINYHIYQQYNGSGYNDFATGKSDMASDSFLCENVNK